MSETSENLSSKTADELVDKLTWKSGDETMLNKLLAMGEPGVDAIVEYFIKMDYEAASWDYLKRALEEMGDHAFEKITNNLQYAEFNDSRAEELFELLEGFGQHMIPHLSQINLNHKQNERGRKIEFI